MNQYPDSQMFLKVTRPGLQAGDAARLAGDVARYWKPREICQLLTDPCTDVRQVAAMVLGLVGDCNVMHALARALRDPDEKVNQMAEHGLWSIWCRSGDVKASMIFQQGVALIGEEKHQQAISCFTHAIRIDPTFAEAYNQCALAHFFLDQWERSLLCCKRAIHQIPVHFGAISCMGHCHLQLGQFEEALHCYQWALRLNPHMSVIADAAVKLKQQIQDSNDSSGMFSGHTLEV